MTWLCPQCGKRFKNTNQWHSCAVVDIETHFRNKNSAVRLTYDKLMNEVESFGGFTVNPVKTSIQVKALTTFLSIKTKRDHLEIEFSLGREVDAFPVCRAIRISKNRVLHLAVLEGPEDVDSQVVGWLREAYDLVAE